MKNTTKNTAVAATALDKQSNVNDNAELHQSPAQLFPDIEPWPEPVDGVALAGEIKGLFERYLYLPNGASTAVTMWVLHTYGVDNFEISPRLYISSPMPGCGKSTLMDLVGLLSYRTLGVSNITAAAMFRIIAEHRPTLLIDEADTFLKGNEELRGIINAGYEQGGKVSRVEIINKKQEVSLFSCYGACAIAGIGGTHKTIQERAVNIIMKRKTHADKIERMRKREIRDITAHIQQKCLRWVQDHGVERRRALLKTVLDMGDRTADIWEPLFAIAEIISPVWLECINNASKALNKIQPNDDETSLRFQLLADIKSIFAGHSSNAFYSSGRMAELLNEIEEAPWSEFGYGRGLNPHSLAKQLRFFGIVPQQLRQGDARNRGYHYSDFLDAFSRYLPAETPAQPEPEQASRRHNGTLENAKAEMLEDLRQSGVDPDTLTWVESLDCVDSTSEPPTQAQDVPDWDTIPDMPY